MATLTKRDQSMVAVIVLAVAIAALYWYFLWSPKQAELAVMRQLVPTSNEVPALLDQVSTAARRAGLELGAVEPEPVIVGDQFDTYRYRMALFGTYHEVAEFLTNVGSLGRIIAPINLQLT